MNTQQIKRLSLAAAVAAALAGCATQGGTQTSQGGTSATGQGAAAGAIIGGLLGYMRDRDVGDALAGAAIGAAMGAIIGNIVDHQRTKSAQQVQQQYGPQERLVLNDIQLSNQILRPGQKGEAALNYDVVSRNPNQQKVEHTVEYYHANKKLASNTQQVNVAPGGYRTVFPLSVPNGAEEGEYRLVARVSGNAGYDEASREFRVVYARNDDAELRVVRIIPR